MLPEITIIFILVTHTFSVNLMPGLPLPDDETTTQPESDPSFRSAKVSALSYTKVRNGEICCKNGCVFHPKYGNIFLDCKPNELACIGCADRFDPTFCWTIPDCPSQDSDSNIKTVYNGRKLLDSALEDTETGRTMLEDLDTSFMSAKVSALSSDKSDNVAKEKVCCKNGCIYYPKSGNQESVLDCKPEGGPCKTCSGGWFAPRICSTVPNCQSQDAALDSITQETDSRMQEDLNISFVSAKVSALLSEKSDNNKKVCCKNGCIYYPNGSNESVLGGPCKSGGRYIPRYCWPFPSCP